MALAESDIKFRKSVVQTDTDANGGRKGTIEILSGALHALFPRVTKSQRESGTVRYRKQFLCNENADDLAAYGVLVYLMRYTIAGDRFYMAKGTQRDTQATFARKDDVDTYASTRFDRVWMGCGQLDTALSGGESEVVLAMENNDFQFPNDGYLYLSNNTMVGQTIDDDVKIGDSVEYTGSSWSKRSNTTDITYPNGWCVDTGAVLSLDASTNEEFLKIAKNETANEVIGSGDGSTINPILSDLAHVATTNGVCRQPDLLPVVKTVCDGAERTVYIAADGTCSGYCSAGELNMADGTWTTDISWNSAPDDGEDITITYCERAFSYSGNVCTVELAGTVANAYSADGSTFASGCVYEEEMACSVDSWEESSSSGTYDEGTYPLGLHNDGTVEEDWTLTFSSASDFTVSGAYYGTVGSGTISGDFAPTNPNTGQPYFTLSADGWGGTWASGETIMFSTHPSAVPILLEQEVPAGTGAESVNPVPLRAYME